MEISSPVFADGERIPAKYTCDGAGVSPPLDFAEVPASAESLVLMMDDPDAPAGTFVHWTVWNIDPGTRHIGEAAAPAGARQGTTTARSIGYFGPCPPSGTHRYFFRLYALDSDLPLEEGADAGKLKDAVEMHMIEMDEFHGVYSRV